VIKTIAHPTDFSEASGRAFVHAMGLALATRSRLCLMHVRATADKDAWGSFPHVRALLEKWGHLSAKASHAAIEAELGITIEKIEIAHADPVAGLAEFIIAHRPDLMVMATHGREGLSRWLAGSVSEEIARRTHVPSLFIGPDAHGFVDETSGEIRLNRVLLPVAHEPSPRHAYGVLAGILADLGVPSSAIRLLHVGETAPALQTATSELPEVQLASGPVVATILEEAASSLADLIAMPTAGHKGILDAVEGSTTEQVLRRAPCPLLALPAPQRLGA
jgi:nucleotide-binding universal stress UspA family protein